MSAVVRKSSPVVIRPSRPVTMSETAVKVSSFDKGLEKLPVISLLVFENTIHEPANTIMGALSETLVQYYPFAGRFVAGIRDGEQDHILCNGEGVAFISATCNCDLKEAISIDHSPCERVLLKELAISYPAKGCGPTDPLLLMQVTEFSCGGFVLGVTWNHVIADAAGMAQFLQAVGELARGLSSPTIIPVRFDESLPSRSIDPSKVALWQVMLTLDPLDLACLDITIPSRSIDLIRAEFSNHFDCQPCSMFEAVSAILWQCRTRAIMSNPETPALLSFAVNLRKYVGAKPGYYGYCVSGQVVMASSGTVANADILDLIKMIKRAKEDISHTYVVSQISNQTEANKSQMQHLGHQLRYNKLALSSWRNLGFENADFGSGKPARVTSCPEEMQPFPTCILCPPCQGEGGANVVSGCFVKEEHAEAFLHELAKYM